MGKELTIENNKKSPKNEDFEWLSDENKKVILSQLFPQGTRDEDMKYCISVAKQFNLNPILKQIYFVPRRSNANGVWIEKVEPVAGRDSYLTMAHRTGQFEGIESYTEIKQIPIIDNEKWVMKEDLVATAVVYRKDTEKPFIVTVSFNEYAQRTKDGNLTNFWKTKPETMLKKVAESQALRKAFNITGLYDETELSDNNTISKVNNNAKIEKSNINSINNLLLKKEQQESKAIEVVANDNGLFSEE